MSERLYRQAKAQQARKEQRRREAQTQHSFKPQLRQRSRGAVGSTSAESRFDSLYRQAMSQQERRATAKGYDPECSFTPKTNKHKATSADGQLRGQARLDRLYSTAQAKAGRLEAERQRKLENDCPFSPNLEATAKQRQSSGSASSNGSRSESLYRDARAKAERRTLAREAQEGKLSFRPNTNTRPKPVPRRSLYPDPADVEKRKMDLEMQRAYREMHGCTFAPTIDPRSRDTPTLSDSVHDRLYRDATSLRSRKESLRLEREEQAREETPFQ